MGRGTKELHARRLTRTGRSPPGGRRRQHRSAFTPSGET